MVPIHTKISIVLLLFAPVTSLRAQIDIANLELDTTGRPCDAARGDNLTDSMCEKLASLVGGTESKCSHLGKLTNGKCAGKASKCRTLCSMVMPSSTWRVQVKYELEVMTKSQLQDEGSTAQEYKEFADEEPELLRQFETRPNGSVSWVEEIEEYANEDWFNFVAQHESYFTPQVRTVFEKPVLNRLMVKSEAFTEAGLSALKA